MPVFQLSEVLCFPPPTLARPDGLLAVGGDLAAPRLLLAYQQGIFPWYGEGDPILWWSPDPRLVLFPSEFRCSRRLARTIRQGRFMVTMDKAFARVMALCGQSRASRGEATWIDAAMLAAYCELHELGHAHSVEAWLDGELVGGLYGVAIGRAFFGESMFSLVADSSKVALAALVERLAAWGFALIDCQVATGHLQRLGAREIGREEFLARLDDACKEPGRPGRWG
ncbi:MAG: leucyl/phenylalanyl-tRNA--protein transferase [Thermodesulfobacteriota bacterium]